MHKLKYISFLVINILAINVLRAQQAPMFTHFSNSYAYANAGFNGMSEGINLMGLYRMQWEGFVDPDGNDVAPKTFLLTGDMPIRAIRGLQGYLYRTSRCGLSRSASPD